VVQLMKNPRDHEIDYWIERGFMAGTRGTISVEDEGSGTRLLFENLGPPNQRFPDWMVKIGVYLVMPSVLKEIRGRVQEIQEEEKNRPAQEQKASPWGGSSPWP